MQTHILPNHNNWQLNKGEKRTIPLNLFKLEFHSTDIAPEGLMGLTGAPKVQHGDMHTNTSQIKSEIREVKLKFLQHHHWHSIKESIPKNNWTYDANMTSNMIDDTVEYSIFELWQQINLKCMILRSSVAALSAKDKNLSSQI